jgi:hypothetical protein
MRSLLSFAKTAYFFIRQSYILARQLFFGRKVRDYRMIPIVINNFNRLTFLKMLVEALERRGYTNIYIIDNASTYPPLLDYYAGTPYTVFRLKENTGYLALWKTGIYKQFRNRFFVYTDSDVVPVDECPDDFMARFLDLMHRYPRASKVGFSLKIDDLPDTFSKKEQVVLHESQFWMRPLEKDVYRAAIDTTFALYRPNVKGKAYFHDFTIRTGGALTAHHLPWYNDDANLSEEERYYIEHTKTSTHWTALNPKINK